jgi:hypothetical protein
MYGDWKKGGAHMREGINKTREFIDRAFSLPNNHGVKCPCSRCRNVVCEDKRMLTLHLCKVGFMLGYEVCMHHGESVHQTASVAVEEDIGGVMIGWMRCLLLYDRSLKQTLRILLRQRCKFFLTSLELQKNRCMNTRQ